ncbi:hypothetical protein FRC02_011974 [Tulasnella sp. 418]|nr:hypothetical protein FRC02_011974 [Tulasnella sp. 418]
MSRSDVAKKVFDVAFLIASQVALYYTVQYIVDSMNPREKRADAKQKGSKIMERLGHTNLELTHYEGQVSRAVPAIRGAQIWV